MKNIRWLLLCILLTVTVICALVPVTASADLSSDKSIYVPEHQRYVLMTKANSKKQLYVQFQGEYFGSSGITVEVEIYSDDSLPIDFYINDDPSVYTATQITLRNKILRLADQIDAYVNAVDAVANTQYDGSGKLPFSDVCHYNYATYGTKIPVDKMTYEMLLIAKEMYKDTDGAFNPTVYRLVDLWGFSSRIYSKGDFGFPYDREVTSEEFVYNGYPLPDEKYISAFSAPDFTDFSDDAVILSHEGDKYYVTKNVKPALVDGESYEQWIDLGGIAKGYVVDGIYGMLNSEGITRCYANAGSSSMSFGLSLDGKDNLLTIPDPFDQRSLIGLGDMVALTFGKATVSTSGQYVRKYTTNGVEYAHIIDGAKGAPANTGVKLVTVIAPQSSMWASKGDCLTTALTVMGGDKIVDFMNGYLKKNGIQVFVVYQAVDGSKQILSNMDRNSLIKVSNNYDSFIWSVEQNDAGEYFYNSNANPPANLTWLVITLGVIVGLGVVAIIVYHFVKGRRKSLANVAAARKDKPFKLGDFVVYVAVVLVIAVLFIAFFSGDTEQKVKIIKIVDMKTQETLFSYNVDTDQYQINNGTNGWTVKIERYDGFFVTFSKEINGETHFNKMQIKKDGEITVKMVDSVCGFHQDCVKNFPEITKAGGTIVCSPNRIKIVTE